MKTSEKIDNLIEETKNAKDSNILFLNNNLNKLWNIFADDYHDMQLRYPGPGEEQERWIKDISETYSTELFEFGIIICESAPERFKKTRIYKEIVEEIKERRLKYLKAE